MNDERKTIGITTNNNNKSAGTTSIQCPLCGIGPVVNEVCPGSCGSLEGLVLEDLVHKSRTFGFDWANGYVAPFLGIHRSAVQEAFVSARLEKKDTVVDLGCGDGRICHLACAMGASQAVGYDLDESLIATANSQESLLLCDTSSKGGDVGKASTAKPSFYIGNLFEVGLEPFSIITMFLLPETTDKLVSRLQQALSHRPDLRIIAFGWPIPGLGEAVASYTNKTGSLLDKWYLYASNPEFQTTAKEVNQTTLV